MNDLEIARKINSFSKVVFTVRDLGKILEIPNTGLRVAVSRLVKRGILQKAGRGLYYPYGKILVPEEVACQIYYPSYLSLKTVLSKNGVLNQVPRQIFLVTSKKSYQTIIGGVKIIYRQIKPELFWGYQSQNNIPTASSEKALLDLLYYVARGREVVSFAEIDQNRLNRKLLSRLSRKFPEKVGQLVAKLLARS